MSNDKAKASEEQLVYASLLGKGAGLGLGVLLITFIIYVSGMLTNVIGLDKIERYWKLRVSEYIHQTGWPTGWHWIGLLNHGDILNYIGIALLAGMTVICYLRLIPMFARKKDVTYLVILIIEIGILLLAASGILTAGGH